MIRSINSVNRSSVGRIFTYFFSVVVNIFSVILADDDIKPISLPGADFCTRDHLARLEFVFLIDHSASETIELMPRVIQVIDDLQETYNGSKFGITLYSDFECVAWQDKRYCFSEKNKNKYHHDPEGCYTFHEALTDDIELIKSRVAKGKIKFYPSGGNEAGINGLMMTGADHRVGWTKGNEDIDVNKFIVLITDYSTYVGGTPRSTDGKPREPARGDGTDKCSRMKGATAELTRDVLKRHGISVFVLLTRDMEKLKDAWKKSMDGIAKYDIAFLRDNNDEWHGKLKDFITDVALSSPRVTCEDPPGYNTLGL